MRFPPTHQGERLLDVDITAMVDVVFLLIIFFMTTAQFARMTKAEVNLPKESGEEEQASESPGVVINVLDSGAYIVENEAVAFTRLSRMLEAEIRGAVGGPESVDVLVRADLDAPASSINAVATELARFGVRGWRLATEPPAGGAP